MTNAGDKLMNLPWLSRLSTQRSVNIQALGVFFWPAPQHTYAYLSYYIVFTAHPINSDNLVTVMSVVSVIIESAPWYREGYVFILIA